MLRHLGVKFGKPVPTFYKAADDMKTGMGVIIDEAEKTVGFPAAATATNVCFVDKERIATGANAGGIDFSDYEEEFVTINEGDFVKLHIPEEGERRATDQFDGELEIGDALAVGTDGIWIKAGTGVSSKFQYGGEFMDNGKALAIIVVLNDAITNE